jgi:malate dehydrogenase (oxaloacetate-decarboxylating)
MNPDAMVFALSNPDPEITLKDAIAGWARIYAAGRSDVPVQINNLIAFPWILRWAIDGRIPRIEEKHKIAAAESLAGMIASPHEELLLPDSLDPMAATVVAAAVMQCQ